MSRAERALREHPSVRAALAFGREHTHVEVLVFLNDGDIDPEDKDAVKRTRKILWYVSRASLAWAVTLFQAYHARNQRDGPQALADNERRTDLRHLISQSLTSPR